MLVAFMSINDYVEFATGINGTRWYENGEHIMCFTGYAATGFGAPSPIHTCLFLQNSGGAPGHSIPPLLDILKNHGCGLCGSVPLFAPEGDNDVSRGELTINYVGGFLC